MRENGVYDRLYSQSFSSVNHDDQSIPGGEVGKFLQSDIELLRTS